MRGLIRAKLTKCDRSLSGHVSDRGAPRCFVGCVCMCFPTHDLGCRVFLFAGSLQPPASLALGVNTGHRGVAPSGVASPRSFSYLSDGPHGAPANLMTPGLGPGTPRLHGKRQRPFGTQKSHPPTSAVSVCCWLCVFQKSCANIVCNRVPCRALTRQRCDGRVATGVGHSAVSCPFHPNHHEATALQATATCVRVVHSRNPVGKSAHKAEVQHPAGSGPGTEALPGSSGDRNSSPCSLNSEGEDTLPHVSCRVNFRVEACRLAQCRLDRGVPDVFESRTRSSLPTSLDEWPFSPTHQLFLRYKEQTNGCCLRKSNRKTR